MADINNFFYLNRAQYDSITPDPNTVYFVLESSEAANDLVSLYTGAAKQTDLMDITHILEANSIENLSNNTAATIPDSLKIPNKLFLVKNPNIIDENSEGAYEAYMYDSSIQPNGAFLKVFGTPNHIIVCNDGLPSVEDALEGYLYVLQQDGVKKNTYIFDGSNYSEIIDLSDFLTIENISQYISQPDNITILKNQNNELYGVGANLSGKTINIGGTDYTASEGATIYNDYSGNKTVGAYSNVFGQNNTSKSSYSAIFGKGNSDNSTSANDASNLLIGINNTVNGNSVQNSVFGYNNILNASSGTGNLINGSNNNISGSNINYNLIYGSSNITGLTTIEHSIVGGMSNTINGTACTQSVIIGTNNQTFVQGSSYGNIIIGGYITSTLNSNRGCLVIGQGLVFSPEQQTDGRVLLGKYNDSTVTDSVFTLGNGTESLRSDCVRLSSLGLLQLCGANGNAVTVNGDTIESDREYLDSITSDGASYTSTYLPKNSGELLLSQLHTVASITITNISQMFYDNGRGVSTKAVSDCYNSVIIFKKDASITSVEDILTNFTATDNTKIYLLNKDLDISTYDIIHVMLFNDGFHICAIVAGYDDESANI